MVTDPFESWSFDTRDEFGYVPGPDVEALLRTRMSSASTRTTTSLVSKPNAGQGYFYEMWKQVIEQSLYRVTEEERQTQILDNDESHWTPVTVKEKTEMKAANLFAAASLLGTATLEPHGWTLGPRAPQPRKGSGKKHARKVQKKIVKASQRRNRK